MLNIQRLSANPIIKPHMDARMGENINGPSLIRVPDWLPDPLGKYYLYFAHHKGAYIRMAYSDHLDGPWQTHEPGVLGLEDAYCLDHVASPDIHMDGDAREIRMYYHGVYSGKDQRSKVALSHDGLDFTARDEVLGYSYFRVFQWGGFYYALGMPGVFYRSEDGLTGFEEGPTLFSKNMRHTAVKVHGDTLHVFYSNVGDNPEGIMLATIDLTPDLMSWKESEAVAVLEPEADYEGTSLPLAPSVRGLSIPPVRQLRDPGLFEEGGVTYLLYSVAGEQGIAIAKLEGAW